MARRTEQQGRQLTLAFPEELVVGSKRDHSRHGAGLRCALRHLAAGILVIRGWTAARWSRLRTLARGAQAAEGRGAHQHSVVRTRLSRNGLWPAGLSCCAVAADKLAQGPGVASARLLLPGPVRSCPWKPVLASGACLLYLYCAFLSGRHGNVDRRHGAPNAPNAHTAHRRLAARLRSAC